MPCRRCGGLLIAQPTSVVEDGPVSQAWADAWVCVNCGEVIDPMIVFNRGLDAAALVRRTHRYGTRQCPTRDHALLVAARSSGG